MVHTIMALLLMGLRMATVDTSSAKAVITRDRLGITLPKAKELLSMISKTILTQDSGSTICQMVTVNRNGKMAHITRVIF